MVYSPLPIECSLLVPEDGFDDLDFAGLEWHETLKRSQTLPSVPATLSEAFPDFCQKEILTLKTSTLSDMCSDQISTSTIYRTECSQIQNLVTGGSPDGWYQAPSPRPTTSTFAGTMLYFAPFTTVSAVATCGTTDPMLLPVLLPTGNIAGTKCMQLETNGVDQSSGTPELGLKAGKFEAVEQRTEVVAQGTRNTELENTQGSVVGSRTRLNATARLFKPACWTPVEAASVPMPSYSTHVPAGHEAGGAEATKVEEADQYHTTVMLRNLPNDYTRDMLMELLDTKGFGGNYDFLYLPFDFRRQAGLGYAFVNFSTHEEALRAMLELVGFKDWKVLSQKVLQVSWSNPLQGLAKNIQRYRNSPVMHPDVPDEFKPLLLENGHCVSFPPPQCKLAPPAGL